MADMYGSTHTHTARDVEEVESFQMDQPSQPVAASASRSRLALACVAVAATSIGAYVTVNRADGGGAMAGGVEAPQPAAFEALHKAKPLGDLTCDEFDDDTIYPNDGCNFGDSGVCEKEVATSHNYWDICGAACDETEMAMREEDERPSSLYTNASWAVVCGWEAVTQLPDLCVNNFTSWIPTSSENKAPRYDSFEDAPDSEADITNTTVDACNLHAFCVSCEFTDKEGDSTYNKYCKAMTGYYGSRSLYKLTNFFNHLDKFWCHADVLESIEKGTFADKFHDPYASMLGRKESDSLRNQGGGLLSPRNSQPALP